MENECLALKQKKGSPFCDFWHMHNSMLQTPFSRLKKHGPTNLYMIYPMAQSAAQFCVEMDKQMPAQGHCPLSSSSPSWKSKIVWRAGCASIINLNFEFCLRIQHPSVPIRGPTC
jgi:hypothetical protein